jgi:glyceraldehyde 3-phosphate dehydrogenase
MPLRFAINGLGRVGRALARIAASHPRIELVAVNDIVPARQLVRLLARDSVHGPFAVETGLWAGGISFAGRRVPVFSEPDPARIDWAATGATVVVEATGRFLGRAQAAAHLRGAVRNVVVSANDDPADPADAVVCLGVNQGAFDPQSHPVASNASCTTNCLALLSKVLDDRFGLRRALMNTVHSYTESQRLLDLPHADPRRSRAAALNIVPTGTTATHALTRLLPALAGRVEGLAVRVPTPAVALLDLVADLERPATLAELRAAFTTAAAGAMNGYLGVTEEELVSSDFINDPRSAVVDLPLLQVVDGKLVRVMAWYDNEWGYSHRLADLLAQIADGAS